MECKIASVKRNDSAKLLRIEWTNGTFANFPYVWLRDNCPESHTYELSDICKGRKLVMTDLDVAVVPESLELVDNQVVITWPIGLKSHYSARWLFDRNLFDSRIKTMRNSLNLDCKVLWSAQEYRTKHLRWHSFPQLLSDDSKLLECLLDFVKFGLVLMAEVPTELGQLALLTKRIGVGYPTHYGSFFKVKSDPNPTNVAYTNGPIGLHIDLPYLEYPPQIQLLHCIEQSQGNGGDSLFADGFHVFEQMKQSKPEWCKLLTEVEFEFWDDCYTGNSAYKLTQKRPVFNLNSKAQLKQIIYSNQMRSWFCDVDGSSDLINVYAAMKAFDNRLHSEDNLFQFKMKPGQLCMFDNLRVLHGRSGFDVGGQNGSRLLEGCYFNWDFVKSKIRSIQTQLGTFGQVTV